FIGAQPFSSWDSRISPDLEVFFRVSLCIIAPPGLPSAQRALTTKTCAFLGRISYSMYLVHFTLIGFLGSFIVEAEVEIEPA
ncbi:hypothetical protein LU640_30585, partial [Pseudomonas monteilii]|nr:hypothetical protein [Pseudomonas monteilii]MCE1038961.1 hypothetical protein [Pseudomonas monteilii]MCE1090947.1 hypothetical protein [Pseudomonas monteilii]